MKNKNWLIGVSFLITITGIVYFITGIVDLYVDCDKFTFLWLVSGVLFVLVGFCFDIIYILDRTREAENPKEVVVPEIVISVEGHKICEGGNVLSKIEIPYSKYSEYIEIIKRVSGDKIAAIKMFRKFLEDDYLFRPGLAESKKIIESEMGSWTNIHPRNH